MVGTFRRVGDAPFPGGKAKIHCGVYEWDPRDARIFGKFKIRFLSPDGQQGPRDYYVEPLLCNWLTGKPTCFLSDACRAGYKALVSLGDTFAGGEDGFRLWAALFRNRHAGHTSIRNRLAHAADFVEMAPSGQVCLIAPALDGECSTEGITLRTAAKRALRTALAGFSLAPSLHKYPFGAYMAAMESSFQGTGGKGADDARIIEWVRSALIFGPNSRDDEEGALRDRRLTSLFLARLMKSVKRRSVKEFDQWLRNARQHQYLALLGSTRGRGPEREEAARTAHGLYCVALWAAYAEMARCFGALMLRVLVDFVLQDQNNPSPEEEWLFQQQHFPQRYLAGLPLDFLPVPQLRCILQGVTPLWRALIMDPAQYDRYAQMLGIYGMFVRARRKADCKRKAPIARGADSLESVAHDAGNRPNREGTQRWSGPTAVRPVSPPSCQECGENLELFDAAPGEGPSGGRATYYCNFCKSQCHL
jgi:hypothetical protein